MSDREMWGDPELEGNISFNTSEHQNGLLVRMFELKEKEEL
jgi:hypothetical protein